MNNLNRLFCSLSLLILISQIGNSQNIEVNIKKSQGNQEIISKVNGISYIFKTNKPVDFSSGKTIVFPDSTDALLTELREGRKIEAELKVLADDYKLLFIEEGNFADYYKNEEDWLSHFFANIIQTTDTDSTLGEIEKITEIISDSVPTKEFKGESNESMDLFLNTLKGIVLENDRAELLSTRIKKGTNIKEQKKIIGFIFSNFNLEQSKFSLIKQLLEHPSYSKLNNDFLMSFVDQFKLESNKVNVLKKLME